jgi:hypothetical protein
MELLSQLYYDPTTGFISQEKLYQKAKPLDPTITRKLVKTFLSTQEIAQVHKKRHKSYQYPLTAYAPFSRLQIDLLDVSNENPPQNRGTRFLFLAIDVFSRYLFAIPLKSKSEAQCSQALITILSQIPQTYIPRQIDSDSESAFKSHAFSKLCLDRNIKQNFAQIGDHASLGIVDRVCSTLRSYIAKYQDSRQSQHYIDILPSLVENYNTTIHSTLKDTPTNAILTGGITDYLHNQTVKASQVAYNKTDYPPGTLVRLLIKRQLFDKGQARFTKTTHSITELKDGLYYVSDRVGGYRKSELQLITQTDSPPDFEDAGEEQQPDLEELREAQQAERRQVRLQAKEGVERNTHTITEEEEKQARKARALRRRPVNHPFMLSH